MSQQEVLVVSNNNLNNEFEYQMLTEDSVNSLIDQKLTAKTKKTVWWNPETNKYYSTNNPDPYKPHYDTYVCDGRTVGTGIIALKGASGNNNLSQTEIDKYQFSGIQPEFLDQA